MKREWLIEARNKKGLTQQAVAKLWDVSKQFYCFVEYGQRRPKPEKAKELAKILKFKWTKLYD